MLTRQSPAATQSHLSLEKKGVIFHSCAANTSPLSYLETVLSNFFSTRLATGNPQPPLPLASMDKPEPPLSSFPQKVNSYSGSLFALNPTYSLQSITGKKAYFWFLCPSFIYEHGSEFGENRKSDLGPGKQAVMSLQQSSEFLYSHGLGPSWPFFLDHSQPWQAPPAGSWEAPLTCSTILNASCFILKS